MLGMLWDALKCLYAAANVVVCTYALVLGVAYLWATWAARD